MAAASTVPDIHYSVQVGRELKVDTNIQPDAEKSTKYFVYAGYMSSQEYKDNIFIIIIIIILIVIIIEG